MRRASLDRERACGAAWFGAGDAAIFKPLTNIRWVYEFFDESHSLLRKVRVFIVKISKERTRTMH